MGLQMKEEKGEKTRRESVTKMKKHNHHATWAHPYIMEAKITIPPQHHHNQQPIQML